MPKASGKIVVILGPTASGKSDIAIRLARKFGGEIISADSRQIYRGMDLGSGKVTKKEQRLAEHWMLDIVSPKTNYNVAKFKKQSDKIIKDILKRKKVPIICGGTGFWIKALVDNIYFPEVAPDNLLRNMLRNKTANDLFARLQKLDPVRAQNIDPNNKVRLIRAIEIARVLGRVPKYKIRDSKHDILQIGVDIPKTQLHHNIQKRLEKRFRQGMIAEVKRLHKQGASWKRLEGFGLEYRRIAEYLQNKITRTEMEEKLYFDIIHYAKRQMTWFQKDKRIQWLKNYLTIQKEVASFLKK